MSREQQLFAGALMLVALATVVEVTAASRAVLLVAPAEYFGTTYVAPPAERSAYVFFVGEPFTLRVQVVNRGSSEITLRAKAPSADTTLSANSASPGIQLVVRPETFLTRDTGVVNEVAWIPEFRLQPGEGLMWLADVTAAVPGEHLLDFNVQLVDGDDLPISPQANRLAFEIRATSADTVVERNWREASRAFVRGDNENANRLLDSVLRNNPQSHAAYVLRGQIAQRTGARAQAVEAYSQALVLLESGADTQYFRWANARLLSGKIADLQNAVGRLRQ